MQTLEEKIRVLEDIEAIKKLKASYCLLADAGIAGHANKMDEFLDLFTEDVIMDMGEFGVCEGKEAQTKFFKETATGWFSYTAHNVHNPIIEIEGEKAKGTWYFNVSFTLRKTNRAAWMQGIYEENYIKLGGKWKFKLVKIMFDYVTPFDEGWVKTRMVSV